MTIQDQEMDAWVKARLGNPWLALGMVWERYPLGCRIPRRVWEGETRLRQAVGMPPRREDLIDDGPDGQA